MAKGGNYSIIDWIYAQQFGSSEERLRKKDDIEQEVSDLVKAKMLANSKKNKRLKTYVGLNSFMTDTSPEGVNFTAIKDAQNIQWQNKVTNQIQAARSIEVIDGILDEIDTQGEEYEDKTKETVKKAAEAKKAELSKAKPEAKAEPKVQDYVRRAERANIDELDSIIKEAESLEYSPERKSILRELGEIKAREYGSLEELQLGEVSAATTVRQLERIEPASAVVESEIKSKLKELGGE